MRAALPTALASVALLGCATVGPGVTGSVDLAPPGTDEIHFVYLGSGGWIIEHGEEMVMTGPLFSNPSFVRSGLWRIESDTALVDRYMSRYDVRRTAAILVGHAHYDHLMDVPRTATHHAPAARIVGTPTVANTLGSWSGLEDRLIVVGDSLGAFDRVGRWIELGPRLRVMALRSHHAPHFDGYTLYRGTRDRPMRRRPRTADEWVDGNSVAFLVDFLDDDGVVAFRVFYQDAVSEPPRGLAPPTVIDEHPVDVAIVVPATFDQVDWHPEALLENLRPDRVLLGHWEDFFVPIDEPTRSIGLTDMQHFERRLTSSFGDAWWRPGPFTEFRFPRR